MKRRTITIAVIALLALSAGVECSASVDSVRAIWAVGDGEKIARDELNSQHKRGNAFWDGKGIKLFAARNEVIAFQVIVEAGVAGIKELSAALGELKQKGGQQKIVYRPPGSDPSQTVGRPIQLFSVNYLNVVR